jgi:hypothetical protein
LDDVNVHSIPNNNQFQIVRRNDFPFRILHFQSRGFSGAFIQALKTLLAAGEDWAQNGQFHSLAAYQMRPGTGRSHQTACIVGLADRVIAELTLLGGERAQRRTDAARDHS